MAISRYSGSYSYQYEVSKVVKRSSVRQERLLRIFGSNIRRWRRVNGMSATTLAERAFITRETLRNIETGTGTPRIDSLFAVLTALGIADTVITAVDPYNNQAARARIDDILGTGEAP
ncbi:helix-turn-helix domain-containing protein [Glaciibacter superstes]|uniref:helix-turn-helix domain-containing protein n=1 Tax=Glaciibacter superstes TaxID=501023 RepID=UPI0009FB9F46|nr:helix-turn-helix transcriptional regulator [Glaciibacter superstes]